MPSGKYATSFVKTYETIGLKDVSRLVGPFDIAPASELEQMGAGIEGAYIVGHYSASLTNPENVKFLKAWNETYPGVAVDPFAVQAYDAMAAIAFAVKKTDGKFDGESFVTALKGWTHNSPRGPIVIDAETRDVVQNQYVMQVRRLPDGKLGEVVVEVIPNVKDPWRVLNIGK